MAATVENGHFSHLKPGLPGMVHSLAHNRPGSPVIDSFSKITVNGNLREDYSSSSDDSDEDENDFELAIKRANAILEPSVLDSRDESTADNWVKRNASMVRLTGKHPFNAEAPLSRLVEIGFITPVPLHYVRNHGPVTKANWDEWTVDVSGLVKQPTRFTMEQLVNDFRSKEFPVTLVCAGNRRKEQNMTKQTIGFNWGAAGVSTTVWRGVPLRSVLKRCGILTKKQGALHVCFEGAEDLPGGGGSKYGTSITREMALDPSRDIILAYMQNGERLAPDHGFPVRMIIPGFIGGRMVKWLKRIFVTTKESDNYYHFRDNRVLPSHVDPELATAEGWWYKPEHIINELNINSAISTPAHDEILPINSRTTQRPYTLKGYAYSGGGKKVTRVEITMNGGETWNVCTLDCPEKPNKYGKYWCWCFWSIEVEVLDILGAKEIAVRAWDQSLNTQPEKLIWNLMGMMNNCWFKVKIHICKTRKGEVGILFEHPTLPGNQSGGWMMKERQVEKAADNQTVKKSVSSPVINTNSKLISLAEVEKHKSADSPWIIVHGNVYDCTRFLKDHPGGTDSILIKLVVKIYFKNVHPKFPDGGLMTQHLDSMELGSFIDVKGPLGHIEYTGKGNFLVHGKPKFAKKLAMIAGGSGITPIYQVMQAILKDDEDETEMHVVYANRTEDDILLRDELDEWAEKYPNRVKLWYVVQESIKEGWKYSLGFITEDILREHTPEASPFSLALACGPPPMLQFAVNPNLEKMGYDIKESLLVF